MSASTRFQHADTVAQNDPRRRPVPESDATPGQYCWQTQDICGNCADLSVAPPLLDLEVGIAVEFVFVEALDRLRFGERHPALPDRALAIPGDAGIQLVGVIFHILEHLVGGVALDDLLDPPIAPLLQADMHHVRIAE